MPRPHEFDDDPQEADLERFGAETVRCPQCGAEVYDEADWCHRCGRVMGAAEDRSPPTWAMVTVALVVAGLILAILW